MKRKIDLEGAVTNINTIDLMLSSYPSLQDMPLSIKKEILRLSKETEVKLHGTPILEQAPSLTALNGKSAYFSNPTLRCTELQTNNTERSREAAFTHITEKLRLATLNTSSMSLEEKVNLLLELELERQLQNPNEVDCRNLSCFRNAHLAALNRKRQEVYNSMVAADWEGVLQRYEETGQFFLDLGDCKVYPIVLDVVTKQPDLRFGVKPLRDLATCGVFNLEDEKLCRETEKQNNTNPYVRITVSHMHRFRWTLDCYNRAVEELLASFKGMVGQKLAEFRGTHGGMLTPSLTIPASEARVRMVGGDEVLLGWKIVIKDTAEESPKRKLLDRILDIG